jgi:hypothetical protein
VIGARLDDANGLDSGTLLDFRTTTKAGYAGDYLDLTCRRNWSEMVRGT